VRVGGTVIKRARRKRRLTQAALAKMVGVHQVTIARIETGARRPSMDLLQRLASALRVKMTDLLS
jgi:uncharacterized protein